MGRRAPHLHPPQPGSQKHVQTEAVSLDKPPDGPAIHPTSREILPALPTGITPKALAAMRHGPAIPLPLVLRTVPIGQRERRSGLSPLDPRIVGPVHGHGFSKGDQGAQFCLVRSGLEVQIQLGESLLQPRLCRLSCRSQPAASDQ